MVALMWLISNILIALRCLKTVIISGTIGLFISFICSPLLIREYGANGVSWSQIISLISICLCMIIVLIKTIRDKLVKEGKK